MRRKAEAKEMMERLKKNVGTRGGSRIDCRGGAKYIARVSAREILCATPTFDVIFKVVA